MAAMAAALVATTSAYAQETTKTALFAGGNFWYLEKTFDYTPGVIRAQSGYTGGPDNAATYQKVTNGGSGHKMAVEVTYDPKRISYEKLLQVYWHSIDPTNHAGQFCESGDQYRTVIYYKTPEEKKAAMLSVVEASDEIDDNGISTRVVEAGAFYPAEEYHQDYHRKEDYKYTFNRKRCKVDDALKAVWGGDANVDE